MTCHASPWLWVACVAAIGAFCVAGPVPGAAVANLTASATKPKPVADLSNVELKASPSRSLYKTTAPQQEQQQQRRQSPDSKGSAAQVGFYKVDSDAPGIPSGLRPPKAPRQGARPEQDGRSARIRAGGRGGARQNADFFEEDAETLDEDDLKTKGRGRGGSRRPQVSSDDDDAVDVDRQRAPPRAPQAGYRPFGGGEVVVAAPQKKNNKEDAHSEEDDSSDFGEHSGGADGGGSHSSSYSSGDHDDYKADDSGAEGDDHHDNHDHHEQQHHADDAGEGAAYKAHDIDAAEDDGPAAHSADVVSDDVHDKLAPIKQVEDIKPVSEESGEHGDKAHASASTDARSEDYHEGPRSHHFVKGGEQKHKAEHHHAVGEKGSKGYKKKQAKDSAEKGHHGKEAHKSLSEAKKGHKNKHLDQAGKYAEKHEGEKGKTGAEFADKGKHKKGHSTKGFRKVHRKDEFKKDELFYDEADTQGHHAKKGSVEKKHEGKKGEKQEKKHLDAKHDVGKASKQAEKGQAKHSQAKKGHKGEEHEEGKHQTLSKSVKEGGAKAAHKSVHAKAGHGDDY